jgi:hypothetical protein
MFIPGFVFHIAATLLMLAGLVWSFSRRSGGWWDIDFLAPAKALGVLLIYALYWILILSIKGCAGH